MRRIQTDRDLVKYILLTLVTCGIYGYYFIYMLAKDVNDMCRDDGQKTGGLVAFIALSFLSCGVYAYYWYFQIANRLQAAAPKYGFSLSESGTSVLLWCLIPPFGQYVAMHIIIKNANMMAVAYNRSNGMM